MWNIDPKNSVMVGDYLYDIQAGFEAGSRPSSFKEVNRQVLLRKPPFQPNYEIHSFLELYDSHISMGL